ncbi:MAG: alkane 1-monooxygenase [Gammaproteobacteria bacterium]|nr:alkane 1-monooxygenase [Gammaproteobacteria bacterium]
MLKYLKFSLFHCLSLPFFIGIILGSHWMVSGLLVLSLVIVFGDLLFGDDSSEPDYQHPWLLNALLYSALPALCLVFFAMMWSLSEQDLFGFGQLIQQLTGFDALAARQTNLLWHYGAMCMAGGLLISLLGTVPAHELTHRTSDPVAMLAGRWLLAFSWDTTFAIEHVYGHHRYVATAKDPASAPRGRNVYQHIWHSTVAGNISAWRIEAQRLQKHQHALLSVHNRVIRGIAISLLLSALALVLAGWQGLLAFTVSALLAKALLEIVNYVEHYGLSRQQNEQVKPYHSWNSNKRISSWASFNLTRHSHHHARATVPFYQLKAVADAPQLPTGYLGCILLALIPPLWFRLMAPRLAHWDQQYGVLHSK